MGYERHVQQHVGFCTNITCWNTRHINPSNTVAVVRMALFFKQIDKSFDWVCAVIPHDAACRKAEQHARALTYARQRLKKANDGWHVTCNDLEYSSTNRADFCAAQRSAAHIYVRACFFQCRLRLRRRHHPKWTDLVVSTSTILIRWKT